MAYAYPSSTFSNLTTRISSPNSFTNPYFPNFTHKSRKFKIFLSFQPPNSLEDANHNDPHANSSTLSKSKIWVNPKIRVNRKIWVNPKIRVNPKTLSSGRVCSKTQHAISSLAKLSKSDSNEQQVSKILTGLGDNVPEPNAVHVLYNIANPEIAILALEYFKKKIEPKRHVVLYNWLFKLLREIKDFEKAEKVFEEMLQIGVKPNVLTFSILIRFASVCSLPHKSVELFEMMPSFGCGTDHSVSSSMIYVYARLGYVDMALKLYDDAKNKKWPVRIVAFSSLIKMHGFLGNYDECLSVYNDMKALGVGLDLRVYNALLYAMSKAKRARDAQGLYEEMKMNGILPNWATYCELLQAYSRGRLSKEALSVYKKMKEMGKTMNKFLYSLLLDMCADVGCVDEAVEIFEDMKRSETCEPDLVDYSSLIKMYSCVGKVSEAEAMLNEMVSHGLEPNILILTSFVQCYGKAKRTNDIVNILNQIWETGITHNDCFWNCLLNAMTELPKEELGKITNCIEKANPKLGYIVAYLMEGREVDGYFIKEISELLSSAKDDVKKSLCNSQIDLCVKLGFLLQLAASLDSSDPTQEQVSAILNCLGDKDIVEKDAVFILDNMVNPKTALVALRYLRDKIQYVRYNRAVPYNVTLKVFRKCNDFEGALKVFGEMIQRGVKPDNITFTTMINCAMMSATPDKAVQLFEKMRGFGCEPDAITCSAMVCAYAQTNHVDFALRLYDFAKIEKWPIDAVTFSALIKMFDLSGNYDGCLNIYLEMKSLGLKPDVKTYNILLVAMWRCKRHWQAKTIYQEMISNGVSPDYTTYSTLLRVCTRAQFDKDALCVYKEMKGKGINLTIDLYNVLLSMCAKVGANDEALEVFEDMKRSGTCHPDIWTFSALINVYSNCGKVSEIERVLDEMIKSGFEPNIYVMVSLVKFYGKAKQIDNVVNVFDQFLNLGIIPDDRLCGCLLNIMTQTPNEELGKLINCVEKANTKLGCLVRYLVEGQDSDRDFIKDVSELLNSIDAEAKRPICNSLIDLCVSLNLPDRAHTLLSIGLMHEIYRSMQSRSQTKWSLHLKNLSIGAAMTAFHAWINDLSKALESGETFPPLLGINTGRRKPKDYSKGIASVLESHLKELNVPFHEDPNEAGWILVTEEAAKPWLESRDSIQSIAALGSMVLNAPSMALPH